jgi:hypothetical protein
MKTMKVSFEISEERFLECLDLAGEDLGLELSEDLNMDKLVMEFNEDVANYIVQDLTGFLRRSFIYALIGRVKMKIN